MSASLPLDVADQLFPIAQGKNPWKTPPTHIDQVPDAEVFAAMRESEHRLEVFCTLTGEQARQNCLPRK